MLIIEPNTGKIMDANPAAIFFYGYTHEHLTSLTIFDLNTLPSASIQENILLTKSGKQNLFTFRHRIAGGVLRDVEVRTGIMEMDGEEIIFSIIIDITERKRLEDALRRSSGESELRFRSMANSAPVMIWVSGTDKLCTWFNNVWLNFTGRSMEEELGNGWAEGVYPDDLNRCFEIYNTFFDAREPFMMEYRLRRADKEYSWILDHGVPRYDEAGNFSGYIGSCIDISESKKYQTQLKSLASELSLAQERERRQIATEIHDYVVQDLAFAKIRLNLILRSEASDTLQIVRDIIDRTINKLRTLVFDLSSPVLYELGLVAALEGLGERLGKDYGFHFAIKANGGLPPVAEETKVALFQIVRELLLNAAKHAQAEHVNLAISRDEHVIRLSVEDNGCGFDVEKMSMEATAQNSFGLFSIRQRLNYLDGTFEIHSLYNRGTRVDLAIPHPSSDCTQGEIQV